MTKTPNTTGTPTGAAGRTPARRLPGPRVSPELLPTHFPAAAGCAVCAARRDPVVLLRQARVELAWAAAALACSVLVTAFYAVVVLAGAVPPTVPLVWAYAGMGVLAGLAAGDLDRVARAARQLYRRLPVTSPFEAHR